VLLYPVISAFISKATSTAAVQGYQSAVKAIDTNKQDAMLAAARAYNVRDSKTNAFSIADSWENSLYQSLLNVDGIMGYLDIPTVKIYLPIYHGISQEVLQKGVGHLPQSSLPIGGEGHHAVLSSHCGLPNAHLFTDLDQLKIGDRFFVHVLELTLAYQVDQIQVVFPEEVQALEPMPGKDYLTLFTCTPYGINSHRLLIRGIRIPYIAEAERNIAVDMNDAPKPISSGLWIPLVLLIIIFICCFGRYHKKKK
ncbi:MAG: class C sortase, partial [Clostridiales bacterium]